MLLSAETARIIPANNMKMREISLRIFPPDWTRPMPLANQDANSGAPAQQVNTGIRSSGSKSSYITRETTIRN